MENQITASFEYISSGSRTNPPIVFLHAFPLNSSMWSEQLEYFGERYYCVALDLPGFGKSKLKTINALTFEAYVEHFHTFLERESIDKAVWVGLSMGAYVLLRAYEKFPEKATKLILCDTKAEADGNEAKLKRWENVKMIENDFDAFKVAQWNALVGTESKKDTALLNRFKTIVSQNSKSAIQSALIALTTRTDTTSHLKNIKVPTTVLVGSEDKVTPLKDAQNLASAISGSQLRIVQGAGHLSNLEDPTHFNNLLSEALALR